MTTYTPRRATKKRWLEGAPEYVLDCFYDKASDSYDVLFTGALLGTIEGEPQDFSHVYVMGLDISRSGAWASFELKAFEAVNYRYHHAHHRRSWKDLPKEVRGSIERWAKMDVAA